MIEFTVGNLRRVINKAIRTKKVSLDSPVLVMLDIPGEIGNGKYPKPVLTASEAILRKHSEELYRAVSEGESDGISALVIFQRKAGKL